MFYGIVYFLSQGFLLKQKVGIDLSNSKDRTEIFVRAVWDVNTDLAWQPNFSVQRLHQSSEYVIPRTKDPT